MTWEEIKTEIQSTFKSDILKWHEYNSKRIYADIPSDQLIAFSRFLFFELGARFIIASGVDTPNGVIEILYHFDFNQLPQVFSLRVMLDRKKPEIESLAPMIKGTEWIEREIAELLGVKFNNHPNPEHLLLPLDWPEEKYPLRRDYE